jgi:hypothetical protein
MHRQLIEEGSHGAALLNVTLAASCDNGSTFSTNAITNVGTLEDRQWFDTWEDHPKPLGAPDLVLDYGNFAFEHMIFHQVSSPACASPVAGPVIDVTHPECPIVDNSPDCYQWPGNLAVDENNGDVYVTYNTQGNPNNDDVVVTRVDGGAAVPVTTQAPVHPFIAANNRKDVRLVHRHGGGPASNVYVVGNERHPETQTTDVYFTVSRDRGQTWRTPVKVNNGPRPPRSRGSWPETGGRSRSCITAPARRVPPPRRSPRPASGRCGWPSP